MPGAKPYGGVGEAVGRDGGSGSSDVTLVDGGLGERGREKGEEEDLEGGGGKHRG